MAFQLPPAGAAPPNFGGYQMQPQQATLQSTQAVQPLQQPMQAAQQLQQQNQQYGNMAPGMQNMLPSANTPPPNFRNYFATQNTGTPQLSPQVNGLVRRVQPISLQGANPQFRRYAGLN